MKCTICDSVDVVELPVPHPSRSVVSDGSIFPWALRKSSCCVCGATSHSESLSKDKVRTFYSTDYDLGLYNSGFDVRRGGSYASLVKREAGSLQPRDVLEIGCGAGFVLKELSKIWPRSGFTGLEAASSLTVGVPQPGITILNRYLEDFSAPPGSFDLIFAINVIEHAADPCQFLNKISHLLKPEGIAILIFPSAIPNLELLFVDHVHTFTSRAFAILAAKANLRVIANTELAQSTGGDFQCATLMPLSSPHSPLRDSVRPSIPTSNELNDLTRARIRYLTAWRNLDEILLGRLVCHSTVYAFGAGETATLLRAYAPTTWSRIKILLVDDPAGARRLGIPVEAISSTDVGGGAALLLATHPRTQTRLSPYFDNKRFAVTTWHDIVDR
ncbi:Methyltransferase domain-containing protein [Mesorhizobium albiziae]|uniref:Methyltransferase domain-containing protein n=1 Tax=Neomesorhizobium albiziae TaxID=335020 RepID=A0A1I4DU76_9HYPH|nr:class I SAM-dependent methyltransferase [Mesorhizobium albiziae]SFK97238.1 Methyltransferase domain-containing protein [Mesorhizobium albiziae]